LSIHSIWTAPTANHNVQSFLDSSPESNEERNPRKARLALVVATWLVALVVTLPNPAGIVWIWMFPAGLKSAFTKTPPDILDAVIGWVFYVALLLWMGKAEKRWVFAIAYGVMVVALVLNVGGCRQFHRDLNDLH
jgi:hypothetical protein